jgi:hypothetical protein
MPPLPGAQIRRVSTGEAASFQQSACSRPPEPMTSTFIADSRFLEIDRGQS